MKPTVAASSVSPFPLSPPSRSPEGRLAFRARRRGPVVVLSARGQADAFTLSLWRQNVGEAATVAADLGGALIVDTTRLDFLSLRTLATLADDAHRFRRDGIEICLVTTNLAITRLAAGDTRTAHLPIHSTVVSALTTIQLHQRSTPSTALTRPDRTPEITPEEPRAATSGRVHFRVGETVPGHGGLSDTVAARPLPGHR